MNTTYVQKSSTVQKIADSKAASFFDSSSQSESLQRKADMANNAAQREEAPRPNNTGMPDNLKSGIESLSGFSMDDVRVHYNSSKPATVQALAYTQGTDIHVAPGQEKHLPHEAWHVAQQMAGRVSPTTNINGMPVNDNSALEHEADVMGEKAVQCKGMEYGNLFSLEKNKVESVPVQRKIKVGEWTWKEHNRRIIIHLETLDLKSIFIQVLEKMPSAVKVDCDVDVFGDGSEIKKLFLEYLSEWNDCSEQTYIYTDDEIGWEKLIKDVFKYYFHKEHHWETIGVGEYMTGDTTGLGIAASINPYITLKILPFKKPDRLATPSFLDPKIDLSKWGNPDKSTNYGPVSIPLLFRELSSEKKGQLRFSKKETDSSELYDRRFKPYGKSTPIKPWNKETWFATKVIGEKYAEKKEEIQKLLLPDVKIDADKIKKIREYKNSVVLDEKCILLWQRLSGQKGGAHKELDSHPIVLKQIAKVISDNFPDRTLILVGDKTVLAKDLVNCGVKNQIIEIHEFWKISEYKDVFEDRNCQNYFLKLLSLENDAISIGMRSGSLESSALLGIKTIFIDDLGNNAEDRMELWAGNAAYGRKSHVCEEWFESVYSGPVPNYKRLATGNCFTTFERDLFKYLDAIEDTIEYIENTKKILMRNFSDEFFGPVEFAKDDFANGIELIFKEFKKNVEEKKIKERCSEIAILLEHIRVGQEHIRVGQEHVRIGEEYISIGEEEIEKGQQVIGEENIRLGLDEIALGRELIENEKKLSDISKLRKEEKKAYTKASASLETLLSELEQTQGLLHLDCNCMLEKLNEFRKYLEEWVISDNELEQLAGLLSFWIKPENKSDVEGSDEENHANVAMAGGAQGVDAIK